MTIHPFHPKDRAAIDELAIKLHAHFAQVDDTAKSLPFANAVVVLDSRNEPGQRAPQQNMQPARQDVNSAKSLKIAVDIPSGIDKSGRILGGVFCVDLTIAMGALKLKTSIFS